MTDAEATVLRVRNGYIDAICGEMFRLAGDLGLPEWRYNKNVGSFYLRYD